MSPTVTALIDTPELRLGRFRCPPSRPEWRAENTIGPLANVVFPERPVTIRRTATGPQLGDRNWAVLYEPGQRYQRALVDPDGDECTFVELTPATYAELLRSASAAPQAFAAGRVLVDDRTWLAYQECLAAAGSGADPRQVERQLLGVLVATVGSPRVPSGQPDPRVHEACRLLATRLDERLTLSAVADAVGLSTYHFCRLFRAATGLTVHAYRQRLRLRQAFSTCASSSPGQKFSDVAMSTGYASHSHMTTDFRQWLSMSPSTVRDRYARRSAAAGVSEQPFYLR